MYEGERVEPLARAEESADLFRLPGHRFIARVDNERSRRPASRFAVLGSDACAQTRVVPAADPEFLVQESPSGRGPR